MNSNHEQNTPTQNLTPTTSPPPLPNTDKPFYVVAKTKLIALTFLTLGLYQLYWFWKNWVLWKQHSGENMWPVARAIFAIFFTHKLFDIFTSTAEHKTGQAFPSLSTPATIFVVSTILFRVIDRFLEDIIPMILYIILLIGFLAIDAWVFWQAQQQANIACGDAEGLTNNKFSKVNYFFLILGGIVWLLIIFGTIIDVLGL